MGNAKLRQDIQKLSLWIKEAYGSLTFTLLEIGAVPLGDSGEPFHIIPELFPGSQIIAFELDEQLCDQLNREAKQGICYHPVAFGRKNEDRFLFETVHPMCTSLYAPNTELLSRYNGLEVAMPVAISTVQTFGLDDFIAEKQLSPDFIKIDIQGAELDVFKGGIQTLQRVKCIVSEVEFVPLYRKQPLFGDVSSFLSSQGFMFHKFLGLAGRTLAPLVLNDKLNFATQHLWADAMFILDVAGFDDLDDSALLKLGVIAYLYYSPDVSYCCFKIFDSRNGTLLHKQVMGLVG